MAEPMDTSEDVPDVPENGPPPVAPRIRTAVLPDVADVESQHTMTADEEFASLTPLQTYELNEMQSLLEDNVPKRPLIARLESMLALRAEYEGGSQAFVMQIDWLVQSGWRGIRRTRGDGDCFYRSFGFAYVERIMHNEEPIMGVMSAISLLEASRPLLDAAGFESIVYEDFYETLANLINRIVMPGPDGELLTPMALLDAFNNAEVSNSIVAYLRLLTSAQIRADPDAFAPFLFHPETGEPMDVRSFCENLVEAVGKEADHVQITALSRVLRVNINVAYLDGHPHSPEPGHVDFVQFQNTDDGSIPVILLYRPGHYDVLDRREQENAF